MMLVEILLKEEREEFGYRKDFRIAINKKQMIKAHNNDGGT